MSRELDRWLELMDLQALDLDLTLGQPGKGEGRLFGGLVAAQAVVAAGRTVGGDRPIHSLHGYFLRPGRHDRPLRFVVDRIRDGKTFTTRRVVVHQAGEAIFNLSASFCQPEEGISHDGPEPEAPAPESVEPWEQVRARALGAQQLPGFWSPLDLRMIDLPPFEEGETSPPFQRCWMRVRGALPPDPLLHAAMLVYASDRTLLMTATRPHGLPFARRFGASLDHAVWIHRPLRLDDWLLYVAESPVAHAARGLIFGGLYDRGGTRIASVAQEGLIRPLPPK